MIRFSHLKQVQYYNWTNIWPEYIWVLAVMQKGEIQGAVKVCPPQHTASSAKLTNWCFYQIRKSAHLSSSKMYKKLKRNLIGSVFCLDFERSWLEILSCVWAFKTSLDFLRFFKNVWKREVKTPSVQTWNSKFARIPNRS